MHQVRSILCGERPCPNIIYTCFDVECCPSSVGHNVDETAAHYDAMPQSTQSMSCLPTSALGKALQLALWQQDAAT